jgi:hypothetical protein
VLSFVGSEKSLKCPYDLLDCMYLIIDIVNVHTHYKIIILVT